MKFIYKHWIISCLLFNTVLVIIALISVSVTAQMQKEQVKSLSINEDKPAKKEIKKEWKSYINEYERTHVVNHWY